MPDANEVAKSELEAEKAKFGFKRPAAQVSKAESEDEDEDQDMGDLDESDKEEEETDEKEESDEEEAEDESEDDTEEESTEEDEEDDESTEADDEDESEEDEDEESSSQKNKKGVPFKVHNKLRKELGEAKRKLDEALSAGKKEELPDDFQERVDALAKEIGVSDPENLKKIINLVKEVAVDKNVKGLEEKITKLEKIVADKKASEIVDEFPQEWDSFEKQFTKEFPNATAEQIKTARETMRKLAGTKNVGGKSYVHPDTKQEVLDPYPLDYIFFKNKDVFEELVTGKKSKGMEPRASGNGITIDKGEGEIKHLSKSSSAADIRALDKKLSRMEADSNDGLRAPENSNI